MTGLTQRASTKSSENNERPIPGCSRGASWRRVDGKRVEGDSYLGRTGTNVLARVREEISAIDKTGAGTLTFGNPYRIVGESRQREGTIRLPERPGNVGLWESVYVDMDKGPDVSGQSLWGSGKGDRIEDRIAAEDWHLSRDGARLIFSGYDNVVSNGITRATAAVYKGFLWSHAPTNETWQFAMHQTYRINMKLNGQWTPFGNSGEKSAANVWTTTVKPGPNPIVIYSLSANWYKRQDLSPRFDGLGLSYDPHPVAGETNAAHFVKLDDGGTGRHAFGSRPYGLPGDDDSANALHGSWLGGALSSDE